MNWLFKIFDISNKELKEESVEKPKKEFTEDWFIANADKVKWSDYDSSHFDDFSITFKKQFQNYYHFEIKGAAEVLIDGMIAPFVNKSRFDILEVIMENEKKQLGPSFEKLMSDRKTLDDFIKKMK